MNKRIWKRIRYIAKKKKTQIMAAYLSGLILVSQATSCSCQRTMIERERALRVSLSEEYEGRIAYIIDSYENQLSNKEVKDSFTNDAKTIAKLLYGFYRYNLSEKGKLMIVDVILNRVDCPVCDFGDSIYEVCTKEGQWPSMSDHYLEEDYILVVNRLVEGSAILPTDCYWLSVNDGKVSARNDFIESKASVIFNG